MDFDEAVIPHYCCNEIPIDILKTLVNINEKYLKEKSTWYKIKDSLQYFKVRHDYRLFTEQFFSEFGKQIMELDTVNYQLASVCKLSIGSTSKKHNKKIGLLSENFQNPDKNYYLISELLNSNISDLVNYSGFSLKNLLLFFKQTLTEKDYEINKNFLIKLFISDAFTLQADRNYHNIGFEINKIEGINYKERLRPNLLVNHKEAEKFIKIENSYPKLTNFKPSKVYDNERILGIDHKNVFLYKKEDIWRPLFPYQNDLLFDTKEQAKKISETEYFNLDPNLLELYINYPKESTPYIERLAYDDEYKKIFENFSKPNSQIRLYPKTKDYFEGILKNQQENFQKILKL